MNDTRNLPALQQANLPEAIASRGIDQASWNAMKGAIYPGASDTMMALVLDYCKSRNLDPLKKPVHIVSVWDDDSRRMVETIWEGIASHRTTAARTGEYAGQDRPVFGPTVTESLGGTAVTHPEWCEVTVYRVVHGARCPFTAVVRWLEAYAKKKGGAPNSMWSRRAFGQIAKCAEAAALRMAFPEEIGGAPSAEEMEGQSFDVLPRPGAEVIAQAKVMAKDDGIDAVAKWAQTLDDAGKTALRSSWAEIKACVQQVEPDAPDEAPSQRDTDYDFICDAIDNGSDHAGVDRLIRDYIATHDDREGAAMLAARANQVNP